MLTCTRGSRGSGGSSNRGNVTDWKISICLSTGATTGLATGATTGLAEGDACSGKYESGSGTLAVGLTVRALIPARGGNELSSIARFAA